MNTKSALKLGMALPLLSILLAQLSNALAQGTAFTYQGHLNDGNAPANGRFDFSFALCTSATGPTINANVSSLNVGVTNGLFTTPVDFGPNFFDGRAYWLEIGVRTNGIGSAFAVLQPRQPITPTPSAQYAALAGTVANGAITASQLDINSVGKEALQPDAVTSAKIANGTITPADVNPSTFGTTFWKVDGNAGTATPNFLGTTDNQPLEFKVDGVRALRLEPHGAGAPSIAGGYFQNSVAGASGAVIAGGGTSGSINEALGNYAFVGAGHGSKAGGLSAVVGGAYNVSPSPFSFIGSGLGNTNLGGAAVIVGGSNNLVTALAVNAFIGGGVQNTANNIYATIGGGELNVASTFSTVGGGCGNQSGGGYSTVTGGRGNQSIGTYASAGGGYVNVSGGQNSTVAGGALNVGESTSSAIGGGSNNVIQAGSDASVIAGGQNNSIRPNSVASTIAGGEWNTNEAVHTTIGGGMGNRTGALGATVGGGLQNTSSGAGATVGGGLGNSSSRDGATVPGGLFNSAEGQLSFAAGNRAKANHRGSFVWSDSQGFDFTSTTEDQFSIRAMGGVRLETPEVTINGRPLLTSADLGNLWQLGGNNIAPGQFLGTANAEPLEFKVNGKRALRLEPNTSVPNVVGGCEENYVTPGIYGATIGGGGLILSANKVESLFGTIGGGTGNTISGFWGTVAGGSENTAGGGTVVHEGAIADNGGMNATVGGGNANISSGWGATVPGGVLNAATAYCSFAAGYRAKANHNGSFVWADSQSADFASTRANEFSIRASGGVHLSDDTPNLSFGSTTRQMLNLWNTRYGIGVQSSTLYFRADNGTSTDGFAWFKGGSHAEAAKDPGAGGQMLMALDDRGLFVTKGDLHWSVGGALVDNQGGSIELGPQSSSSARTPFIDFHYSSGVINIEDYNVRLINDANRRLTVDGNLNVTGTISPPSDRNVKAGFEPVDTKAILEKVAALPITRWHYTNDTATPHLGPVAQDFHAAFGLGSDDKHIATVDADGVALAAVQGLNLKLEEKEKEIKELKRSMEELKGLVSKLVGRQNGNAQ